ncbi:MAG: GHKL domain-containing protein, partial [Anaerolineae bacterium]|nr:GHKL domain-containing protein [Anaerolineae bacterium]
AVNEVLQEQMSRSLDIVAGLSAYPVTLLDLNESSGAAIYFNKRLILHGQTPTANRILDVIDWLNERNNNQLYYTNQLSTVYPPAQADINTAAGLLALPISNLTGDWLLWFKPEKVQTVTWAGNPKKAVTVKADGLRLSPRKSFKQWTEIVHGKSLPWHPAERSAAQKLREHITNIMVQYTRQIESINTQLQKANEELDAFSYSISHDLRSPLRLIDSYAEILLEDYEDQLEEEAQQVLNVITKNAAKMNQLIEDILSYSRVGRAKKIHNQLDLTPIIDELIEFFQEVEKKCTIAFEVGPLPPLYGDYPLIQQLFFNILSNAVKYTRPADQPRIEIHGEQKDNEILYTIADNGIGFDMVYADEIFNVFSRLHADENEFEGTGIGLALVKRIVQSHHGRVWVESRSGQGSTFYLAFPLPAAAE